MNLVPGQANVYFEIAFPKLASSDLREQMAQACATRINQIASPDVRKTWLNQPYGGGNDPTAILALAEKTLKGANEPIGLSTEDLTDFYCWQGEDRTCYSTLEPLSGGQSIVIEASAGGLQLECPLLLMVATMQIEST